MSDREPEWILVSASRSFKAISESELILIAVGIETRIDRGSYAWLLYTRSEMGVLARKQLALHREENRILTVQRAPSPVIDRGFVGVAAFVAVIWLFWIFENIGYIGAFRYRGDMWASAVLDGEWWRTFTALVLHADAAHLVGNTAFGIIFGILAGRVFGSGLAWLLILCCGAAGNLLNAHIQAASFHSIGASTAVFAAAGLVGGLFFRRRFIKGRGWRYNALPIVGLIGIFAFLGVGTERVDIMAHLTGLFCGAVTGAVVGNFDLRRLGKSGQWLGGASALLILAVACLHV